MSKIKTLSMLCVVAIQSGCVDTLFATEDEAKKIALRSQFLDGEVAHFKDLEYSKKIKNFNEKFDESTKNRSYISKKDTSEEENSLILPLFFNSKKQNEQLSIEQKSNESTNNQLNADEKILTSPTSQYSVESTNLDKTKETLPLYVKNFSQKFDESTDSRLYKEQKLPINKNELLSDEQWIYEISRKQKTSQPKYEIEDEITDLNNDQIRKIWIYMNNKKYEEVDDNGVHYSRALQLGKQNTKMIKIWRPFSNKNVEKIIPFLKKAGLIIFKRRLCYFCSFHEFKKEV